MSHSDRTRLQLLQASAGTSPQIRAPYSDPPSPGYSSLPFEILPLNWHLHTLGDDAADLPEPEPRPEKYFSKSTASALNFRASNAMKTRRTLDPDSENYGLRTSQKEVGEAELVKCRRLNWDGFTVDPRVIIS